MPTAPLLDRGVVRVSGPEARTFLDGLLTCAMDLVSPERARLGALLTPQGKILFDFIVNEAPEEDGGGFYLDVLRGFSAELAKRLAFYKLRAKVTVEDISAGLAVAAGWGDAPRPDPAIGLIAEDPRLPALGWRAVIPRAEAGIFGPEVAADAYHAHRIALGVPEGSKDYLFGDTFPHEALLDQLHGVDFDKGCYVGQEVVSRMQHRGTARTRVIQLDYAEGIVAESGVDVTAGGRTLGTTGTGANGRGLALVRLDRAADALAAGEPILAGGLVARPHKPDWATFAFPMA